MSKQVDIYRKKSEEYDKLGGKAKMTKLEEMSKDFKEEM